MTALAPSKTTNAYWIHATCSHLQIKQTDRTGKWLLFPLREDLDTVWPKDC